METANSPHDGDTSSPSYGAFLMTTQTFGEWAIGKLRDAGAYAGAYDGVEGRQYIEALKRFQYSRGLKQTGRADDDTVIALRLVPKRRPDGTTPDLVVAEPPPKITEPVWLRDARRYLGVREIPGPKSNPIILGFAKKLGGWVEAWYKDDDTPWCGLFVANNIATTLPEEPMPANPLGALNWKKFGKEVEPCIGAILVFGRKGAGLGHVGYYLGETATHYIVLGANQDNSVSIKTIPKDRLQEGGSRWPVTGEAPIGGRVFRTVANAASSKSEA